MRKSIAFLAVIFIGCQSKSDDKIVSTANAPIKEVKSKEVDEPDADEKRFRDSLYTRESDNYVSRIEEIPNRETDAYRITITSKNGSLVKSKVIDTRPQMSRITSCNDIYAIVSFPCGGPCLSEVFVFINKTRPEEQYDYVAHVKNEPTIITHIKNEEFDNLIVRNLANNKELSVDVSKNSFYGNEFIDSITRTENNLIIHYISANDQEKSKTINIKSIL